MPSKPQYLLFFLKTLLLKFCWNISDNNYGLRQIFNAPSGVVCCDFRYINIIFASVNYWITELSLSFACCPKSAVITVCYRCICFHKRNSTMCSQRFMIIWWVSASFKLHINGKRITLGLFVMSKSVAPKKFRNLLLSMVFIFGRITICTGTAKVHSSNNT